MRADRWAYQEAHRAVRAARGPASVQLCRCGRFATEWAYNHLDPNELRGPGAKDINSRFSFSNNPQYYVALCRRCHSRFDTLTAIKKQRRS